MLLALSILERDGLALLPGTIVAFATLAVVAIAATVYAVGIDHVIDLLLSG